MIASFSERTESEIRSPEQKFVDETQNFENSLTSQPKNLLFTYSFDLTPLNSFVWGLIPDGNGFYKANANDPFYPDTNYQLHQINKRINPAIDFEFSKVNSIKLFFSGSLYKFNSALSFDTNFTVTVMSLIGYVDPTKIVAGSINNGQNTIFNSVLGAMSYDVGTNTMTYLAVNQKHDLLKDHSTFANLIIEGKNLSLYSTVGFVLDGLTPEIKEYLSSSFFYNYIEFTLFYQGLNIVK